MSAVPDIPWKGPDPQTELQTLFQNAPFAWMQCDRDGTLTPLNASSESLLELSSGPAESHHFRELLPAQDRSEAEALLESVFQKRRHGFQLDTHIPLAENRPIRWTAWRVPGKYGRPDTALLLMEDLPANHEADQRLRQAERLEAVGRLAGGVAHDFNNLLTGVLLYCDLLIANLEPCHRVRKYAEEIRKAGMQATGLVRQLLAVARPAKAEPRMLSLNEVAEGMRNLLVRLIGENIELKFQLDANLGLIKIDPTQAQQILLNLALNARDAMPGGGAITIETRNCKVQVLPELAGAGSEASLPCALFVVADTGCGMDAATRAHVFDAFFTTKGAKGNGLGLATVHDIVTTSGGLIYVDSAPGRGTRVSVLLPLVPLPGACGVAATEFHPDVNRETLIPESEK